ncbi:MAG TPA: 3-isopropylmalate dehydrogenase [Thermoanaerobaculia bacterium]|nr:3-isopropylmalate dehydrogenase [Thermoanaerobaculia bacterium]
MGRRARIALLPGDGIGPEVAAAAVRVLEAVARKFSHRFDLAAYPIGAAALCAEGTPLPDGTLKACLASDAVFLAAVGDPSFDAAPPAKRPEAGLLALRKALGVYANLRPGRLFAGLNGAGPLKPEVSFGLDLVIVRELTGGLYYGTPRRLDLAGGSAVNTLPYTRAEIERVAEIAFRLAEGRRRLVTSVDKSNVLETSQLWRAVVTEVAARHPGVTLEHQLVDSCAMGLVAAPARFDVLVMENLFGDILSDEVGALVGSLGLLPSASLGDGPGLFEPVHGSAPALAGRNVANPVGAVASAAMLLRHGLSLPEEAAAVERAIEAALASGARTADLVPPGGPALSTTGMTETIVHALDGER